MKHLLLAFVGIMALTVDSFAATEISRFSGLAGLGQSSSKSADAAGTVRIEGPLGFGFYIDYSWKDSYFLFAEHMRSMSGSATSVGLSGLGLKYYPWLSPQKFKVSNIEKIESTALYYSGYAFYFGGSLGFAQASVLATSTKESALAAGIYINGKAGADFPMSQNWGFREEFNSSFLIAGSGNVQYFNLLIGTFIDL